MTYSNLSAQPAGDPQEVQSSRIKIGELLVVAGLVSQENLDSSVSLSVKMRMPLGRILSMHGYMGEDMLENALEVQDMIRSGSITLQDAVQVLQNMKHQNVPVQAALKACQRSFDGPQPILDTLRKIGAISEKQRKRAEDASTETALPGGWVLLGQGIITGQLLDAAIVAQRVIDRAYLPPEDALNFLRIARIHQINYRDALARENRHMPVVDTELNKVQLLVDSGLVSNSELLACREYAVLHKLEIEQALFEFGILDDKRNYCFAKTFAQINEGMPVDVATRFLRVMKENDWEWQQDWIDEESDEGPQLMDLLLEAGVVTAEQLGAAKEKAYQTRQPLVKIFLDNKLMEEGLVNVVDECQQLLSEKAICAQQAVILVAYCFDTNCDITKALGDFDWGPYASTLVEPTAA